MNQALLLPAILAKSNHLHFKLPKILGKNNFKVNYLE